MSRIQRAIGIYAEGHRLRLALVHRDGKDYRVESVETVPLRDVLSDSLVSSHTASTDPFGIDSLLNTEELLPADRSNPEILLDVLERYGMEEEVYALGANPDRANFAVFQGNWRPRRKREWLVWGKRQGLALSGTETPRCFSSEDSSCWVLFHPESSPLLELFEQASDFLGKRKPRVRLMEDPCVSLMEGAALSGQADPGKRAVVLHCDGHRGWLIELEGRNLRVLIPLSVQKWQEGLRAWLSGERAPEEPSLFLFSGTLAREEVEPLVRERFPGGKIEPLIVLPWDNSASNTAESLAAFAVPIALAAKALSHRDPRFFPVLPLRQLAWRRSAFLQPSIAAIALVAVTLLVGGNFAVRYIQQLREIGQLRFQIAQLQVVAKGEVEAQTLYTTLESELEATGEGEPLLDSLVATTLPVGPVFDALCRHGRRVGDFWLTDFDWTSEEMTIAGVALRRERIDEVARILPGARLMSVVTRNIGKRTVYPFVLTVPLTMIMEHP